MRKIIGVAVIIAALTCSTFAGDMQNGAPTGTPPNTPGDMQNGTPGSTPNNFAGNTSNDATETDALQEAEIVLNLLQSLLSLP